MSRPIRFEKRDKLATKLRDVDDDDDGAALLNDLLPHAKKHDKILPCCRHTVWHVCNDPLSGLVAHW